MKRSTQSKRLNYRLLRSIAQIEKIWRKKIAQDRYIFAAENQD